MTKKSVKIGDIRLNDDQRLLVAQLVETDVFRLIANVIRPKRQIKIGQMGIRASLDEKDLYFYKGQLSESDWLITFLKNEAEKYNATQLDADSE